MYAEALCGDMPFGGAIERRNRSRRYEWRVISRLPPVRKRPMEKSYLIINLLIEAVPKDDLSNHETTTLMTPSFYVLILRANSIDGIHQRQNNIMREDVVLIGA